MERKLAVILVADIVGYSALMEKDEAGTYARVTARRRDIFEPEIARHQGRIFKLVGDGLLAEFGSAVQAVECAMAVQRSLAERNADVAEDQRILARIGINLGEVIVEGDDRLGEGVNIAARLEQLADPGGICVSEKVAREVERKLAFGFESMGQRRVKNIVEPIHVYRVSADATKGVRRDRPARLFRFTPRLLAAAVVLLAAVAVGVFYLLQQPDARSGPPVLAVLPFSNLSGDPTQDYLGPGIAEDIISMLSTSPLLQVMSKSSSFSMGSDSDPRLVARTLQVDYILEGSLRRNGETFSISTQLVDGRDGKNLWADRLEQDGSNVVLMQERIASKVYATIAGTKGEVSNTEISGTWSKSAPSLEEYDYHLRAMSEFLKWTDDSTYHAWQILSEGLEKFPNSALLRLELAAVYNNRAAEGLTNDPWQDVQMAFKLIREAEEMPDRSRMEQWLLHYMKANVLAVATGNFEEAAREADAAHAMVPYDPMTSVNLAMVMANAGYPDRAVEWAEYAVESEAVVPDWYRNNLAWAYLMAGRTDDAVTTYEGLDYYCIPCKASALVRAGRLDDARAEISEHLGRFPDWTIEHVRTEPTGVTRSWSIVRCGPICRTSGWQGCNNPAAVDQADAFASA